MTLIIDACFSQGISLKDFAINGVPLYHPFQAFVKNGQAENDFGECLSTIFNITYPEKICSSFQQGLIDTGVNGVVKFDFDVYMENTGNGVSRNSEFERKVNMNISVFRNAACLPYTTDSRRGFGIATKPDGEEDYISVLTLSTGGLVGRITTIDILDLFGYADVTSRIVKNIKSIQLANLVPGSLTECTLVALTEALANMYIIRKFSTGV
jgi:hypothetical protein